VKTPGVYFPTTLIRPASNLSHIDLLAVGLMGIVHNVFVAGAPRRPGALGIHIKEKEVISSNTVADVLYQTEQRYPMVGSSLVPIFFSEGMLVPEDRMGFWVKAEELRTEHGLDQLRIRRDVKPADVGY
jgi:hypothetical protein